jgi:tetratricopeptide (TPR) repeat protein
VDEVQRALAGLFGIGDESEQRESALRRKNKKGATAEESSALGAECLAEGEYEAAIAHFRKAVEQRGKQDIAGRIDLGGALEAADRPAEALRQYQRASQMENTAAEPHLGSSQIYKQHGRYDESLVELEKAIELEPRNAFYRFKLAELLRSLKQYDEAIQAAAMAAATAPTDSFYHYWIADLLIELRRFEEALEPMRLALELSPGDDYFYYRASAAFWGAGKQAEAIRAIRLASELDPDKAIYHGLLAEYLLATGMNEEAGLEQKSAEKMDAYDREELARLLELIR